MFVRNKVRVVAASTANNPMRRTNRQTNKKIKYTKQTNKQTNKQKTVFLAHSALPSAFMT